MADPFRAYAISAIFGFGLLAFASGKIRHDLVALLMLSTCILLGLVDAKQAFTGFSDPVVITVGAVMLMSAGISRSGVLSRALKPLRYWMRTETGIAAVFSVLCGVASAFMNNVGALALLLPAALATCRSARVSPSRILMPMAFASLLGGLATLIGTPPNVILAELRTQYSSMPFTMFDFAWVGLPLAMIGILLTIGLTRFLPSRISSEGEPLQFKVADYLFELRVTDKAVGKGLTVDELMSVGDGDDRLAVLAIDRGGVLVTAPRVTRSLRIGDIVQVEGRAPVVEEVLRRFDLELASETEDDLLEGSFIECVVSDSSSLPRSHDAAGELASSGVALVALSRRGKSIASGLSKMGIQFGDLLLLQLPADRRLEITAEYGLLPLAERPLNLGTVATDWLPIIVLIGAILAASLGVASLSVTLVMAVVVLGISGRFHAHAYRDIDWSILVLLAALIPVAQSFAQSGAGEQVAGAIAAFAKERPPWVMIATTLGLTMAITPFLNNAAAVLVMGPIAATAGRDAGIAVDAMLMAVAIGASCDFLTPIGHQSKTLVWVPGGYRFSDYARIGAPLTALVLIVGTTLITIFWG